MITDLYDPEYYRQGKPPPPAWPPEDPIPEVLNTDPRPNVPVPAPVVALERLGAREGWEVRSGYSTGPERAVRVGTYKQTETWGIWSSVHPVSGWRWNAMYSRTVGKTWAWRSTAIWLPGRRPRFTHASRTDLIEFIIASSEVGNAWFKAVQARVEDAAERARAAARNRPRARKEGTS